MRLFDQDAKLATTLSRIVHDRCEDVPHDIGLTLVEAVRAYLLEDRRIVKDGTGCDLLLCDSCGRIYREDDDHFISSCSDPECGRFMQRMVPLGFNDLQRIANGVRIVDGKWTDNGYEVE